MLAEKVTFLLSVHCTPYIRLVYLIKKLYYSLVEYQFSLNLKYLIVKRTFEAKLVSVVSWCPLLRIVLISDSLLFLLTLLNILVKALLAQAIPTRQDYWLSINQVVFDFATSTD